MIINVPVATKKYNFLILIIGLSEGDYVLNATMK